MLVSIAVVTKVMQYVDPQKPFSAQIVDQTLLGIAQGRSKYVVQSACSGSNLDLWALNQEIASFYVMEAGTTTKLLNQHVYPVRCQIKNKKNQTREIIVYLNSLQSENQCVVFVKDPA